MARGNFNNLTGLDNLDPEDIKNFISKEGVGGYSIGNILSSNTFMPQKKNISLSFLIYDIVAIKGNEILKLTLSKVPGAMMRIMKYTNHENMPVAVFDIINFENNETLIKSNKEYVGGLGMDKYFYMGGLITQWEIPVFTKLCRAFVFGDIETIIMLHNEYYLQFDERNELRLRNILGIK